MVFHETLAYWLEASLGSVTLQGVLSGYMMAYLGGVLASLTPCVYPMLPITLSVVTRYRTDKLWAMGFYALGLSQTYTLLGLCSIALGKVLGTFTQTRLCLLIVGNYVLWSALQYLGVLDSLDFSFFSPKNRFKSQVQKWISWDHPFWMGVFSSFIAAPCTTPLLAVVLFYIAQTKHFIQGYLLMLFFGLGFSTLFFMLGWLGMSMRNALLPTSGPWLAKLQKTIGWGLFIFAEYIILKAGEASW